MNCGQPLREFTSDDEALRARLASTAPAPLRDKVRAAAPLAGERRTVTALYVDIVGSTALAERVGDENWAAILNGALDRCTPAIYRYEGTIARFMGDELLAFFGAPVAHEDDPLRAVHAALGLLDAVQAYALQVRQQYGVEFAVRVGLSTGPVIVGSVDSDLSYEYSALGGPLNLAASVESIQWPMQVLITEDTYRFVAPFFDCLDLGLIEIEGQADRVRVYRVRGLREEPEQEGTLPGLTSPMVGRDAELISLVRLSQAVRAGLGRAVLIVGVQGIGKTRLLAEWQAAVVDPAPAAPTTAGPLLQWATAHCFSYSPQIAYYTLVDLLHSLIGVPASAGESKVREALLTLTRELFHPDRADEGTEVYTYLGHLLSLNLEGPARERVQRLDPSELHAQHLTALRLLLRALASRRPLVLILENLHWADPSSVELLIPLLHLSTSAPLLFCLVTRPARSAPGWGLVAAAIEALGGILTELTLYPLSDGQSRQLVCNLLDSAALPDRMWSLILEKAEGNPLFVEEMLRMLIDREAIVPVDGGWSVGAEVRTVQVPDSLRGLLLARIDHLPEEVKHTLRVASVIGRQFSINVLEQVLRKSERSADHFGHLSVLESADLIHVVQVMPELTYRFRHALVQDTAYDSMLPADRQRLHLLVGETLERMYPERQASQGFASTLAQHFANAEGSGPSDEPRALKYFTLAAQAALASYANQEAERHYRSALDLVGQGESAIDERARLLSGLGEALYHQSRFWDAVQIWREAIALYRALENSDGVAHLYARSARAVWSAGDTPESLSLCQEGLKAVVDAPESPGLAFLTHEAARAYLFNGMSDRARPLCQRALEMAERLGIVKAQAEALATLGLLPGQSPEAALASLTKAIELAESAGLLSQAARAHVNLAATLSTIAIDFPSALEHYQRAATLSRQRGNTAGELLDLCGATDLLLKLGRFEEAQSTFQVMHRLQEELVDSGPAAFMMRINEAILLHCRGELSEAARLLRDLQADARRREDLHNLLEVDSELADTLLESRLLSGGTRIGASSPWSEEAEETLSEALQICERWQLSGIYPRCLLSEIRASQGRFEEAHALLDQARETARSRPVGWEYVWPSICQARVAAAQKRWTEALSAYEGVAGSYDELGMRWWWARALYEWAETHVARGEPADLERARALYREAQSAFERLGVPCYAELAGDRLQSANVAIRAEMQTHYRAVQELLTASRIQQSFLPEEPPHIAGWQVAVILDPARETSGDFYDFIPLPNGRWGIVVADVADKGMGAALYMALSRTLIRSYAIEHPTRPDFALQVANRRILMDTQLNMFVTVFYGVLDPMSGTFTYCNAGHNPPYLFSSRKGDDEADEVQVLRRTGTVLGAFEQATWTQQTVQIAAGDSLVLYTDGVTEAHNARGELFGAERVLQVAQANLGRSAQDLRDALRSQVRDFVGDTPQFDDIVLMAVVRDALEEPGRKA